MYLKILELLYWRSNHSWVLWCRRETETIQLVMDVLWDQHGGGRWVQAFDCVIGLDRHNTHHPIWNFPMISKLKLWCHLPSQEITPDPAWLFINYFLAKDCFGFTAENKSCDCLGKNNPLRIRLQLSMWNPTQNCNYPKSWNCSSVCGYFLQHSLDAT